MTDGSRSSAAKDPTWVDWKRFMGLVGRAMARGATHEGPLVTWHLSNKSKHPCAVPREVAHWKCSDRTPAVWDELKSEAPVSILRIYGRCRRCAPCLEQRRLSWLVRTLKECEAALGRIWFVTLTSSPEHREWVERQAQLLAWRDRKILRLLAPTDAYGYRARALRPELSVYLKRLRNGVGRHHRPRIRFIAVIEPHKDKYAHAHLLLFEHSPDQPLFERLIRARWSTNGHVKAKLVDRSAASYVSKYLAKDGLAQVQASRHFGRGF